MRTSLRGVARRRTAEAGSGQVTTAAERQMLRREQDRAYWANWRSNPSQLSEVHTLYSRLGA